MKYAMAAVAAMAVAAFGLAQEQTAPAIRRGQATIDFGFDVPQSSIWAVVDGRTGQASLVTPGKAPVPHARTKVAGVVSANPGVLLGKGGDSQAMIATTGRVRVRRKFHQPGTIIGKALEPLASGEGEILVLLSLQ
jgi:hypothetical protein